MTFNDRNILGRGGDTILNRRALLPALPRLTAAQGRADAMVSSFVYHATDGYSLTAMVGGGLVYRLGRLGTLALGSRFLAPNASLLASSLVRYGSIGVGFTGEVFTFEAGQRALRVGIGGADPSTLRWGGENGLGRGLVGAAITLGSLKGAGAFVNGQNPVLQHLFQDSAMVLSHNLSGAVGITERPRESFAEQMVNAEATLWQLNAGMSLVHGAFPSLRSTERSLDLSLRSREISPPRRNAAASLLSPALQMAGPGGHSLEARDLIHAMSMENGEESSGSGRRESSGTTSPTPAAAVPPSYAARIQQRLASIPPHSFHETEGSLQREWAAWPERGEIPAETAQRIERLLPHYARLALAHLGRETPAHLPFVPEVYEMARAAYLAAEGRAPEAGDRSLLMRFLSTQPGRRALGSGRGGSLHPSILSPSPLSLAETRGLLGESAPRWEQFLREQVHAVSASPLEGAQIYQRGLALMHFYLTYLHAHQGGHSGEAFHEISFRPDLAAQVLRDSARHPYPERSIEIFERFCRETLGQAELHIPRETATESSSAIPDLEPLSLEAPRFHRAQAGEGWSGLLNRLGITRARLDAAELGVAGATVFSWGKDPSTPPGDSLHLLGLVTYLASGDRGWTIDPFEAARLTLLGQMDNFIPDASGRVVIRFPELMADLDYAHFGLGTLIQTYIRNSGAHDVDLARQWGVDESTVSEYRRGIVRKMRMDTLRRLAESLSSTPDQNQDMFNLLVFLRHRAYFDATMVVSDNDGNPLNRRPPFPSDTQIVLVPHGEALRPLDTTRRIRFEREPFASAMNGAVDLALDLLDRQRGEFTLTGQEAIGFPVGSAVERPPQNPEEFAARVRALRDAHTEYFQLLSRQERSPGAVRPGQLREIQEFYRNLFRFFEAAYLHTRPRGEIRVGDIALHYEVVPPTVELPQGVRMVSDLHDPRQIRAYVVAADLLENGRALDASTLGELLKIRVVRALLQHQNLILPGEAHVESNRALLTDFLESTGQFPDAARLTELLENLDGRAADWSTATLDPSQEALIHRITRGGMSQGTAERRQLAWREALHRFALREQIASLAPAFEEVFAAYVEAASHPTLYFEGTRLEEALAPLRDREGPAVAERVRENLIRFMGEMGLPHETSADAPPPSFTLEGFANAAFAGYLGRFRAAHPLRLHGKLIEDLTLLGQVVDERLVDAPYLTPHRDQIVERIRAQLEQYNQRNPLLRIYEVSGTSAHEREPFSPHWLATFYLAVREGLEIERPGSAALLNDRWLYTSLRELRGSLVRGEAPTDADLQRALEAGAARLERMGQPVAREHQALHQTALERWSTQLHASLQSLQRLAPLLTQFVLGERFRSDLDQPARIAQEMTQVYRRHANSALLDVEPTPLKQLLLEEMGQRFPYNSIRDDVVRGLQVIYHEWVRNLGGQYAELLEAMTISREEAGTHRSVDRFRAEFLTLARGIFPHLDSFEALETRIRDLENFLALLIQPIPALISTRLPEMARQIEALPPPAATVPERPAETETPGERPTAPVAEPKAEPPLEETRRTEAPEPPRPVLPPLDPSVVLNVPLDAAVLRRYPELELVEDEALRAQITEERRHLVDPSRRGLFQLLALLGRYEGGLGAESREAYETLLLELETSPESPDWLERHAFAVYDRIRGELLAQVPVLDRVGIFPEFRNGGARLTGAEAGRAIQNLISRRRLFPLQAEAFGEALAASSEEILSGEMDSYHRRIAEIYLANRDPLLKMPEIQIRPDDTQPLNLLYPPRHLRERLERDFPELDLFPDAALTEALAEAERASPGLMAQFWSQASGYLLLKLRGLLSTRFAHVLDHPPLAAAGLQLLEHYPRLTAQVAAGASLPHLAVSSTEALLSEYNRHQRMIWAHLLAHEGADVLFRAFPEIQRERPLSLAVSLEGREGLTPRLPFLETTGRIANRILHAASNNRHRRAIEERLWGFEPPPWDSSLTDLPAAFAPLSTELANYYLDHRGDFRMGTLGERAEIEALRRDEERQLRNLWELAVYPESLATEKQRSMREVFLSTPDDFLGHVFRYRRPDGTIREILLTEEQFQGVLERFARGETVQFESDPGMQVRQADHVSTTPTTPFYRTKMALGAALSPSLFRLWELVSSNPALAPELVTEIQRDLNRATYLITMGVDEAWVLAKVGERILRSYQRHRDPVIARLDLAEEAAQLPELVMVPPYEIDRLRSGADVKPPLSIFFTPENETFTRIYALVFQEGTAETLRRQFTLLMARTAKEDLANLNRRAAEFFLQHRHTLQPRTWPNVPHEILEEISQYPELRAIASEATDLAVMNLIEFAPQLRASDRDHLLLRRITTLLYEDQIPQRLRNDFEAALRIAPGRNAEIMTHAAAQFYYRHRDEILSFRRPR